MIKNRVPLLLIVQGFQLSSPRSIRARKLAEQLSDKYSVHILTFEYPLSKAVSLDYEVHYVEFSFLSKVLHKHYFFPVKKFPIINKLLAIVTFPLRKALIPDPYIIEKKRISKVLRTLNSLYEFRAIVGFVYPFTFYQLGRYTKGEHTDTKWILDIGDPYSKNIAKVGVPVLSAIARTYERKSLRAADALIVTNEPTKELFKSEYLGTCATSIKVIPQGTNQALEKKLQVRHGLELKFVYAGAFYPKIREPYSLFESIKIGDKADHLDIYGQANIYSEKSANISFHGSIAHDLLFDKYLESDVLVYIDNTNGLQTSGKIYELLSLKMPILFIYSEDKSETKFMLKNRNFIFFAKNTTTDIKTSISEIRKKIGAGFAFRYDYDIGAVSWDSRATEYDKFLKSLLAQ